MHFGHKNVWIRPLECALGAIAPGLTIGVDGAKVGVRPLPKFDPGVLMPLEPASEEAVITVHK